MKKPKAIILISGGLDSTLVAHVMREQNVDVLILFFSNPFSMCDSGCSSKNLAEATAERLSVPFRVVYMDQEYLDLIASPKHGYGKNMNPCIDCRIYMLKLAKKIMEKEECDFTVTGEVLGQRPMSQHLKALKLIEREANLAGLVLRPLSAKVLEPTVPEKEGWIDKSKFPVLTGRSRKGQFELARNFGLEKKDYLSPGGGCRLTMQDYAKKFKDLLKYNDKINLNDVILLNKGRHFRISNDFKIIVGRNEQENNFLEKMVNNSEVKLWARDFVGPVCIGFGNVNKDNLKVMAGICGRYSDCPGVEKISFIYYYNGIENTVEAFSYDHNRVLDYKI